MLDVPPPPFTAVDETAMLLCETLIATFGSYDEIAQSTDVQRLPVINRLYEKASGGLQASFTAYTRSSYHSGYLPERMKDKVERDVRQAALEWLREAKPFEGAEEEAERLMGGPSASLFAYGAEYLGKTKEQVREDFWNANLYRHLFDDLTDKLRDDLGEYEDAWLEGDYHYDCKVFYVLPGDTGARFDEPAIEIVLEFNDHEYLAQGDEIARLNFTPEAFRPALIPLLVDKVIAVFQDQ